MTFWPPHEALEGKVEFYRDPEDAGKSGDDPSGRHLGESGAVGTPPKYKARPLGMPGAKEAGIEASSAPDLPPMFDPNLS
jgi:hypothetical protein